MTGEEFRSCLRRLCTRGLVAIAEGESAEEAEASLFQGATVRRQTVAMNERINMFLTSLAHGSGIRFSLRAFRGKPLDRREAELLECLKEQGEIARHLKEIQKKGIEASQGNMEIRDMQAAFLYAIASLYRKKLLFIQKVKKEGQLENQ